MGDGWAYTPLDHEACAACGHCFADHRTDDHTCAYRDAEMGTSCACDGFEPEEDPDR